MNSMTNKILKNSGLKPDLNLSIPNLESGLATMLIKQLFNNEYRDENHRSFWITTSYNVG